MNLDIHYEDPDIYVINKPAGLLSVPGRGDEFYADENPPAAPRLLLHAETLAVTNLHGILQRFHLNPAF